MPKSKGPSIFSNQTCGNSCWNNITVGKTEKQEFLKIISALPNVDQNSIAVFDEPGGDLFDGRILFHFYRVLKDENSLVKISARTKNQRIVFMTFQGDLGLTFQDVSDLFGEPDLVSSLWTFDGGINVHFINSVQGIEITSYFKSERSTVSSDTEINVLSFFATDMYERLLRSSLFVADETFILYPWTGYGKIEDHYWPPQEP
jgi:hypothetical protein